MKKINPIVTIPARITFREPTRKHPGKKNYEDLTVSAVAKDLEDRYDILHIFYRMYKQKIKSAIIEEIKLSWKHESDQNIVNGQIAERIKNMWRMFLVREEHGIKTGAAIAEQRQSFIDTGAYYKSMNIKVE